MWALSFVVEDKFKNLFSEYVEDFEGYLSSSLFTSDETHKRGDIRFFLSLDFENVLGEFHQNKLWMLEVLLSKKPDYSLTKTRLNSLARALNINEYSVNNSNFNNKLNSNKISIIKVVQKDWLNLNRQSFPIINIGKFYIYGSHIKKNNPIHKVPIKINASTAFGTGSHATTKCCLQAVIYLSQRFSPKKILDYGCGTGILGIASKKIFKKSKVIFVDIDSNAVKLCKQNLKINNIKLSCVYLTNSFDNVKYIRNKSYNLIFANILFTPLYKLTPVFKKIIEPHSFLILSGLLKEQIPYIVNRYNNFGFKLEKKIILENWASVIMSLKN